MPWLLPQTSRSTRCAVSWRVSCSTGLTLTRFKASELSCSSRGSPGAAVRPPDDDCRAGYAGAGAFSQQDAHLDRVLVPVGGGGLAAGVAVLIKQLGAADQSRHAVKRKTRLPKAALGCRRASDGFAARRAVCRVACGEALATKRSACAVRVSRRYRHRRQRRHSRARR